MNTGQSDLWLVLGGSFLFLAVCTALALILRWRIAPEGDNPAIENLIDRTNSWWTIGAVLSAAFLAGPLAVTLLFAFCSFAALREFVTLTTKNRADHWSLLAAFFIVLPVQYYLIWANIYGLFSVFVPVYAFLLLPIVAALRGYEKDFLVRISETQYALMICVFCASHVPALLTLDIEGYGGREVLLIFWLVLVVQLSDALQHVVTKLMGRTQIVPRISRSRTWEGVLGGIGGAVVVGTALFWITPFSPPMATLMALIVALIGFGGGLVMSAIKRDRGVRDWGHMLAGHGGLIDRADSVVFAAPIFFHIVRYGWAI